MAIKLDTHAADEDEKVKKKIRNNNAFRILQIFLGGVLAAFIIYTIAVCISTDSKIKKSTERNELLKSQVEEIHIEMASNTNADPEGSTEEQTGPEDVDVELPSAKADAEELIALENKKAEFELDKENPRKLLNDDTTRLIELSGGTGLWYGGSLNFPESPFEWQYCTPYDAGALVTNANGDVTIVPKDTYDVVFICKDTNPDYSNHYILAVCTAKYDTLKKTFFDLHIITTNYGTWYGKPGGIGNSKYTSDVEDTASMTDALLNGGIPDNQGHGTREFEYEDSETAPAAANGEEGTTEKSTETTTEATTEKTTEKTTESKTTKTTKTTTEKTTEATTEGSSSSVITDGDF